MSEIIASGIVQKSTLQQFIDVFTPLVAECRMHFNDDGILVNVVDPSNVAMISPARLHSHGFESYDSPGGATVGVGLNRLDDILGPANSDDLVELELDMETRKLDVRFRGIDQSMALIDPSSIRQEPDTSDLDLPNTMVVKGESLSEAVEVTDMHSDHVYFESEPDEKQIVVWAEGDLDDASVTFGRDDTLEGTEAPEAGWSCFSLEYCDRFTKPIPNNSDVTIEFGDTFPMKWSWSAAEGDIDVTQTLAPRIVDQ